MTAAVASLCIVCMESLFIARSPRYYCLLAWQRNLGQQKLLVHLFNCHISLAVPEGRRQEVHFLNYSGWIPDFC